MSIRSGWFNRMPTRKGVTGVEPLHSDLEWQTKFLWIREDVIPIPMTCRSPDAKLPDLPFASYEGRGWYNIITRTVTPMRHITEVALMRTGMSLLWPFPDLVPNYQKPDGCKYFYHSTLTHHHHLLTFISCAAKGTIMAVLMDTVPRCMKHHSCDKKALPFLDKTRDYFHFPKTTRLEPMVSEAMYMTGKKYFDPLSFYCSCSFGSLIFMWSLCRFWP